MADLASTARPDGRPWAIEALGLRRSYGDRTVVSVDALQVAEGEVLAILGPNGAGKSTLFRLLALLERPDAGVVRYFGRDVTVHDLTARRRTASVFQRPLLFQGSVVENVGYGLRLRRMPRGRVGEKVDHILGFMGISQLAKADMRTLSGGELQRVALARALALEPDILFLDEPTSNLDVHVRRRFREDLRRIVDQLTATVVLITHDQNEALLLAQRVVVISEGGIAQIGTPREVFTRPANRFVADFMGVETVWHGRAVSCDRGMCTVSTQAGNLAEVVAQMEIGSDLVLAIRPEDVALELASPALQSRRPGSSVRNRWRGVIDTVSPAGPLVRVVVHLGTRCTESGGAIGGEGTLVALVTRPSAEELALAPGVAVEASVKATAIHVLQG
jgi:tungstate transport system ATP-binding protein